MPPNGHAGVNLLLNSSSQRLHLLPFSFAWPIGPRIKIRYESRFVQLLQYQLRYCPLAAQTSLYDDPVGSLYNGEPNLIHILSFMAHDLSLKLLPLPIHTTL
jgi:hypothetical protein